MWFYSFHAKDTYAHLSMRVYVLIQTCVCVHTLDPDLGKILFLFILIVFHVFIDFVWLYLG